MDKPRLRRIRFDGRMGPGVTAKDLALAMIRQLGVNGGVGFAYEYAGDAVRAMTMDERMTLCDMSIEGGARVGYVNRNGQECLGHRGVRGNDHMQYAYKVRCTACEHVYGANGSDLFHRRCPCCDRGAKGVLW